MVNPHARNAMDPLGVFDSGLGGLTVVRAIAHSLPGESIVYFGDTARLPYGNKSQRTVRRLSLEALKFLEHFGIKAFVVACNSASALALDVLSESASVPGPAALANALFDATGRRVYAAPFTPDVVRAALNAAPYATPELAQPA